MATNEEKIDYVRKDEEFAAQIILDKQNKVIELEVALVNENIVIAEWADEVVVLKAEIQVLQARNAVGVDIIADYTV